MRHTIAGSVVLALAFMTASKANAEGGRQLTPDEQSLVLLAIRTELTSHHGGWTSKTPLCLRVGVFERGKHRPAQAQAETLRQLNSGGHKVIAEDQCVTRVTTDTNGNERIHFRDANRRPAYLLDVEIIEARDGSRFSLDVGLEDGECAPLSCRASDLYTVRKAKQEWTIDYKGSMVE
jgi:hypothetical protein